MPLDRKASRNPELGVRRHREAASRILMAVANAILNAAFLRGHELDVRLAGRRSLDQYQRLLLARVPPGHAQSPLSR
jgi:hypothetical protein